MTSSAQAFFEHICGSDDPVRALHDLIAAKTSEEEWLDFKGAERIPDKDTKEHWSTALSGFANTEGGVLVWGIDARRDPKTGIDAASALSLVPDPRAFKSRLQQLHPHSTDPPVTGVDVREYIDADANGAGFVVCLVPESSFKPHRADDVRNKPYYLRFGDSFQIPSPSILRHLFFPHTRCRLVAEITARDWDRLDQKEEKSLTFDAVLRNVGTATAHDVCVKVGGHSGKMIPYDDWAWQSGSTPKPRPATFVSQRPLHPGATTRLCWWIQEVYVQSALSARGMEYIPVPKNEGPVRFTIFARDSEPQRSTVTLDEDTIRCRETMIGHTELLRDITIQFNPHEASK